MFRSFLVVGIGGFFGSMARYGVSYIVSRYVTAPFPYGTFIINILGCFIIGLLYGWGMRVQWLQGMGALLLASGFCGGFTTFSTFALENILLIDGRHAGTSIAYMLLSVIIGLLCCKAGMLLTK